MLDRRGVVAIANRESYDLDRLERAVQELVESHERLQREAGVLRADVASKGRRIRELEEQLLDSNQRRQEAGKRLDELISQLDHLDARLAGSEV